MKYKVGDRVRIKSLDWYNENKAMHGDIWLDNAVFVEGQSLYCGCELTIRLVTNDSYYVIENDYYWTDEMIEGLVEDENNHLTEVVVDTVRESNDRYRIVTDPRFDIEVDEGKYYAVRRKKEYPKTYEECCKVMNYCCNPVATKTTHKEELIRKFQFLLLYRDAYWKIAGEEMGLGRPWELSIGIPIYYIYYNRTLGTIKKDYADDIQGNVILAFPTEEMRDAFYENFKELIESCKELL